MPYIDQKLRDNILRNDKTVNKSIMLSELTTPGELNFAVTELVKAYIMNHASRTKPGVHAQINYALINDVVGALEGAKLEFYRRVASPYEDSKIEQNGDVY